MATYDNPDHIERLNQRGGRMLSVMDLLAAGTLNLEIASLLLFLMSKNPSFISCAGPGGAGKTALMGALLAHLPGTVKIIEYGEAPVIPENSCILAHEINWAPYYGYIWGKDVEKFLDLQSREKNVSVCATAHADTPSELEELLAGEHRIRADSLQRLDFLAFINFTTEGRRLTSVFQPVDSGFRKIYSYLPGSGAWEKTDGFDCRKFGISDEEFAEGIKKAGETIGKLLKSGARDIRSVAGLL